MFTIQWHSMAQLLIMKSVASFSVWLTIFFHGFAIAQTENNFLMSQNNVVQQIQEDSINIRVSDLSKTNTLTIAKVNHLNQGNLSGAININGKKIQDLKGNKTSINLSPQLKKGVNRVEVRGQYKPVDSSIKIQFSASSTSIEQVTSGAGRINYNLIISVE